MLESAALVALITAVPSFIPVTSPVDVTVTTLLWFCTFQITSLFVAFAGATVAVNCSLCPASRIIVVLFRLIPVTGITAGFTVTVHSTYLLESAALVALITAVPSFIPVTSPVDVTVTTLLWFCTFQITSLFVAFAGVMAAVSCSLCPASRVISDLFRLIPDTGITPTGSTVTVHSAYLLLSKVLVALITTVPSIFAVTEPVGDTVATLSDP